MKKALLPFLVFVGLLIEALISHARAASVTLQWDPSPDTELVGGYRVYYAAAGSTNVSTINVGLSTMANVPTLISGSTYTFFIVAVATNGIISDPSNVVTYTPVETFPPTFALTLIDQDGVTLSSNLWRITVRWNAAPAIYGVTNYLLIVEQGATSTTNQVGTNLVGVMTTPAFSTTKVFLQAQSPAGFSSLTHVGNYRKPGSSKFLKVTQP